MTSPQPPDDDAPRTPEATKLHLWQIQGVRDVATFLALAAIVYVGYWLREVTVPLLIALALAYLFEPLVRWLCTVRGVTRPGAVLILLLTVGVTATAGLVLTAPLVVGQSIRLVDRVRSSDFVSIGLRAVETLPEQYREEARNALEWVQRQWAVATDGELPEPEESLAEHEPAPSDEETPDEAGSEESDPQERLVDGPAADPPSEEEISEAERERVRELVRAELAAHGIGGEPSVTLPATSPVQGPMHFLGLVGPTAQGVADLLIGILRISLVAFLIPFYFYFFSLYYPQIVEFGRSLVPDARRARTYELVGKMDRAVSGFVRGRIVISVLMGVLFAIGWLICGVPYAIALGFFVGAVSIVPYLGGVGLPLAVGFLLFEQVQVPADDRMAWWAILLWPTVVFALVQLIESYILTPVIAGKATDLDPVTIVVAILAGGSVAGVYGMLLAIPLAACGKILLREVVLPSVRAWARGDAPDPLPIEAPEHSEGGQRTHS